MSAPVSYAFQWRANDINIPGATLATYTPAAGDVGKTLSCTVTAIDASNEMTSVNTIETGMVVAAPGSPPTFTAPPVISDTTPTVGQLLTVTNGTTTGNPTSFSQVWFSATTQVAIGSSYTPVASDVGNALTVNVTASNGVGTPPTDTSAATSPVAAASTTSTNLLAGDDSTFEGGTVGDWAVSYQNASTSTPVNSTGAAKAGTRSMYLDSTAAGNIAVTTAYKTGVTAGQLVIPVAWVDCVNTARECAVQVLFGNAAGYLAATAVYEVTGTVGSFVEITGAGFTAPAGATSAALQFFYYGATAAGEQVYVDECYLYVGSVPAATGPPVFTAPPVVSTTAPQVGNAITGTDGTASQYPTGYLGAWYRAGTTAAVVSNLQPPFSYTPVTADVGHALTLTVTASNGLGSGTDSSAPTAAVIAAPANTSTADFTDNFTTFDMTKWYPCYPYNGELTAGAIDEGSQNSWNSGTSDAFYNAGTFPYQVISDSSATDGKLLRLYCKTTTNTTAAGGKGWVGCIMISQGGWTSGYVEWRMRMPGAGSGPGMWPALWLFGQTQSGSSNGYTQNKASRGRSEIDMLEIFGVEGTWNATVHDVNSAGAVGNDTRYSGPTDNGWHLYGIQWDGASVLNFYYDRTLVASGTASEAANFASQQMCARMNYTVIEGNWAGAPYTTGSTPSTLYMDIDSFNHYAARPF
jgi:hypothetical protein